MPGEPHIDNLLTASRTQALTRAEVEILRDKSVDLSNRMHATLDLDEHEDIIRRRAEIWLAVKDYIMGRKPYAPA